MEGGPANVLVPFIDTRSLQQVYDPENSHILGADLANYLKSPSFDADVRGAYRMYVLRLGQPTAAFLVLNDQAAAPALRLDSVDKGSYVNKISVTVASGSIVGKRLTFKFRQEQTILDNLQNAFHISYTGNGSAATMTITRTADQATRLQTALTGATDGSINLDVPLDQDAFATLTQLVTYLNAQNGYRASVDRFASALLPSAELDSVAAVNIRTPIALVIRYIGAAVACTMTTTDTTLTTTATAVAADNLNVDLTAAPTDTLAELVAYINGLSGKYTCTLGPNADPDTPASPLLAHVTSQDIRTANYSLLAQPGLMDYVASATLGSIITAVNTLVPRVRASRITGAVNAPANLAQTFLAGGTNPVPTMADWLNGLYIVEQEALAGGLVFPVSTDPIVQDATLAWVGAQRSTHGHLFRAFLAPPDNTTAEEAKQLAMGFNSTYAAMIPQAVVGANGLELPPLYAAAMYCGAASGALPTQPVTRMVLRAQRLPDRSKFSKAIREDLLSNGVAALEEVRGIGVRLSLAVTTSLSEDRIDRILSESMARDVIDLRIRTYVEPLIPHWAMMDFMPTVKGVVFDALQSLQADGIISQGRDANGRILPAWLPVQVAINAGIMRITVHVFIGGEIDHVMVFGSISYQTFQIEIPAGA